MVITTMMKDKLERKLMFEIRDGSTSGDVGETPNNPPNLGAISKYLKDPT